MKERVPVAIVGFGSQGRRTAEAVTRQKDMKIIGVALNQPDLSAHLASRIGYPIFSMEPEDMVGFKKAGLSCKGSIDSLLQKAKALVDCTPAGVGKQNKEKFYKKYEVKVVFQAGEEPAIAEVPAFFSLTDYEKAHKAKFVRVASPFAVSIGRTLWALQQHTNVKKAFCTFVRAGSETMRAHQGPVDTIIPESPTNLQRIKWELNRILGELDILMSSVKVPSILLDVQPIFFELTQKARSDSVMDLLTNTPRIIVVSSEAGLFSTDSLFEFFRRTRPHSADIYEVCVWKEQVEAHENMVKLVQAVDSHSVHIPEVIDAIRAMTTTMSKNESMRQTDTALGILNAGLEFGIW